jgi:hypothetical protein
VGGAAGALGALLVLNVPVSYGTLRRTFGLTCAFFAFFAFLASFLARMAARRSSSGRSRASPSAMSRGIEISEESGASGGALPQNLRMIERILDIVCDSARQNRLVTLGERPLLLLNVFDVPVVIFYVVKWRKKRFGERFFLAYIVARGLPEGSSGLVVNFEMWVIGYK